MKTDWPIKSYIDDRAKMVDSALAARFGDMPKVPAALVESMRYSLMAGGKRIRPVLALAAYEACGGQAEDVLQCACALEAVHTYSLIHDDLPAMDDDDLRRGKPTNHKVFGDAMAILAGDALLTEAFAMILEVADGVSVSKLIEAIRELSVAAGPRGMVGGQVQDMAAENSTPDADALDYIHRHKTGALIKASVRIGGILWDASEDKLDALSVYGENIGLAFQVVDDILDVRGDEALIGKPVGSDERKNKLTYPAIYGMDVSLQKAGECVSLAVEALQVFDEKAEPLREIAWYLLRRTH